MSFPTTPAMVALEDSAYYKISSRTEEVTGAMEMESGYVTTRPHHTTPMMRMFTTGFTFITTAEKDKLRDLYSTVGMHTKFVWTNPETAEAIDVIFAQPPEFKYVGMGNNNRWNVEINLEEVL